MQELQFIDHHKVPVKILLLNYSSASDAQSDISNPDFDKLAAAYNLSYVCIRDQQQLVKDLSTVLSSEGGCLCEILLQLEAE